MTTPTPPAEPAGQPAAPPATGTPTPTEPPAPLAGDPPKEPKADVLADLAKERERRKTLETEIAKSLGITTERTGLLLAYRPAPEVLAKFKDGTYTGFSIEGARVQHEVTE